MHIENMLRILLGLGFPALDLKKKTKTQYIKFTKKKKTL